jgi:serine/threonine-protein kinase HipA
VIATFTLPASDWWDEFYIPLEQRIADLEAAARDWPDLAAAIGDAKREISIYRRFGDIYGYVFFVVNRPAE